MTRSKNQILAIETVNKNILVSASAGAGKTTILISRLIKRIIVDQVKITDILAMTFTEAAASEMKKRLLVELNNVASDMTKPQSQRDFAMQQLALAENAKISTIHSFCLNIIENNYAAINLDIRSLKNIITDSLGNKYFSEAFTNVLNTYIVNNQQELALINQAVGTKATGFDNLKAVIEEIVKVANNTIDPIDWFLEIKNKYYKINSINDIPSDIYNLYLNLLRRELSYAKIAVDEMLNDPDYEKNKEAVDFANEVIVNALNTNELTKIYSYIISLAKFKYSFRKPSPKEFNTHIKNLIPYLFKEADLLESYNHQRDVFKVLLTFSELVYLEKQRIKTNNKCIDFGDFEHMAYQILIANDFEVAKKYQKQFEEIMVDEFQDTNNTQDKIINLVSNGHNIFRVGDVKQSIYRFRGAKPSIMQALSKDESIMNLTLANNYRSKKSIVDFNNYLFDRLLNINGLTINYNDEDKQIADLERQIIENEDIKVHLLEKLDDVKDDLNKAMFIASSIKETIGKGKYTKFSDYCVLVKSHASKTSLKKAFEAYNIPYFVDNKLGYLNSYAVEIVIAYLKYLYNPSDKISLTSVLTSPLYQLTIDQVIKLDTCLINEDIKVLNSFNHVKDMISYIININNFYTNKISIQDKTNIDYLFDFVLSDDDFNLNNFIEYLNIAQDSDVTSAIPVSDEDNVVKVMTIHHSKGLQFNVVYLFSTSSFKNMDAKNFIANERFGLALKFNDLHQPLQYNTIEHLVISDYVNFEDIEEQIRLLYVALTRPKDVLHIVDTIKDYDEYPDYNLDLPFMYSRKGFTNLILAAVKSTRFNTEILHYQESFIIKDSYQSRKTIKNIDFYQNNNSTTIENIVPSMHFQQNVVVNFNKSDPFKMGTIVHRLLEVLPSDIPWTKDIITNMYASISNRLIDGIIALQANDLYKQCLSVEHYHEYPFTIKKENTLTNGIIDFISFGNEINIIDFKSDKLYDENTYVDLYKEQLLIYKSSILTIYPSKTINIYIYSLTLKKMIPIT